MELPKLAKLTLAITVLLGAVSSHAQDISGSLTIPDKVTPIPVIMWPPLSTNGCIVQSIQYDGSSLVTTCANRSGNHIIFGSDQKDCKKVGLVSNIDTIKIWHSMLQSALLSGRKVDIGYVSNKACMGGRWAVLAVRLHRQ